MPMRENTSLNPTGHKGAVRAEMATSLTEAHAAGRLRAALVRASDFYGPHVRDSAFGDRVVTRVIAGKKVSMLGSLDVPHSVSYMPDVAATIAAVITTPAAAGRTWLVPNSAAVTQRQVVEALACAGWIRWLEVALVIVLAYALMLDFPTHAAFNVPFAIALAVPLLRLRYSPNASDT